MILRGLESGKQANEVFFGCLRNLSLVFGEFVYRPCFNKLSAKIVSLLGLGHYCAENSNKKKTTATLNNAVA